MNKLIDLLTKYRPAITEVFLAALGTEGTDGFQCELGFGNGGTKSFQAKHLNQAVTLAYDWTTNEVFIDPISGLLALPKQS